MLYRIAESMFWIGRYSERTENLARFIHAWMEFSDKTEDNRQLWVKIVQSFGDQPYFETKHEHYDTYSVLYYFVFDEHHVHSLFTNVKNIVINTKSARERLPEELWELMNSFMIWLNTEESRSMLLESPYLCLRAIIQRLSMFYGAAHHLMVRDAMWYIMETGKYLERSENTWRLLGTWPIVASYDLEKIETIVRNTISAASATDVYRRTFAEPFRINHMLSLLILNDKFTRSIMFSFQALESSLKSLRVIDDTSSTYEKSIRLVGKLRTELQWLETENIHGESFRFILSQQLASVHQLADTVEKAFFRFEQEVQS